MTPEERKIYLAHVAEQHYIWEGEQIERAPFNPDSRPDSGDYNVWNLDMDGDAAAQAAFFQRVDGAGVSTGDDSGND